MELLAAREELKRFTNAPVVVMPGNHDTYGTEGDIPVMFNIIFSNTPAYGAFEVKGLKCFYLFAHNSGDLDPAQESWFQTEAAQLNPTQQVAVFIHQPPLNGISVERGVKRVLVDSFNEWVEPVWTFAGHVHTLGVSPFALKRTNIYQVSVSSANPLVSGSPDGANAWTAGFLIICVKNAQIAGLVFAALTNATFYPLSIPRNPITIRFLFEDIPHPLLLREEGDYDRSEYSEWCKSVFSAYRGFDAGKWWAYVHRWRVRLPLGDYQGMATHVLLSSPSARPDSTNINNTLLRDVQFRLGVDTDHLTPATVVLCSNQTAWIAIPPELRTNNSLWLDVTNSLANPFEFHIGAWGLATTNPVAWPLASRFLSALVNPDGSREFRLLAIPRHPCRIESSSNLMDWVTSEVVPNPSGVIEWRDSTANFGQQWFYRAVQILP